MDVYRRQLLEFRRKFGRDMRPDDPFFFDPNLPAPAFRNPDEAQFAIDLLAELMAEAGIAPEIIYAFKVTGGLLPSAESDFSPIQQAEWDAAMCEFREKLRRTKVQ